uniref:Uncharacterized protein n=1 Tax=Nothoprocta perdicaria TaxID=30464 RepID=A0A8C6Z3U6_NOTPE
MPIAHLLELWKRIEVEPMETEVSGAALDFVPELPRARFEQQRPARAARPLSLRGPRRGPRTVTPSPRCPGGCGCLSGCEQGHSAPGLLLGLLSDVVKTAGFG